MKEWLLKVNRTLFELETGILLFALACQVVIAFFPQRGEWSRGLWIGILTACLCAFHMWYSLDKGLSLTEKGAAGYLGSTEYAENGGCSSCSGYLCCYICRQSSDGIYWCDGAEGISLSAASYEEDQQSSLWGGDPS